MAQQIKITMKENNGTDFDTLYPQTVSNQVIMQDENGALTNKTLDDRVNEIATDGGAFQVGDTLTTARTNLGEKWLLCNGDIVFANQYPDLVNVLGNKALMLAYCMDGKIATSSNSLGYSSNKNPSITQIMFDGDSHYVYLADTVYSSSSRYGVTMVGDSLYNDSGWSTISTRGYKMWRTNNGYIRRLDSYEEYYIGELNTGGSWTSVHYFDQYKYDGGLSNLMYADDFVYFNGKYYYITWNGVYYASQPSAESYIKIALGVNFGSGVNHRLGFSVANNRLFYYETYQYWGSSSVGYQYANVLYDITNGTNKEIFKNTGKSELQDVHVAYINNTYFVLLGDRLFKNNTEEIDLEQATVINTFTTAPTMWQLGDYLLFSDGNYVNPQGEFSTAPIISSGSIGWADIKGTDVILLVKNDASPYTVKIYKTSISPMNVLPTISVTDNLYTYIKALK